MTDTILYIWSKGENVFTTESLLAFLKSIGCGRIGEVIECLKLQVACRWAFEEISNLRKEVVEDTERIRLLEAENIRLRQYDDKLAGDLPEGMLPKDVELLMSEYDKLEVKANQLERDIKYLERDIKYREEQNAELIVALDNCAHYADRALATTLPDDTHLRYAYLRAFPSRELHNIKKEATDALQK